ncbi:MAG TPA: CBS domain-containing protein [Ramlibacter sp.]|jgi:CBS domain-containing protein|nr:CBS domain-containing protein [Ramlibacter sp.]
MFAKDVMSSPVISISPELPVLETAALLVRHRIGGLPVMTDGRLLGMVTESDLLHRYEIGTDSGWDSRSWWRRMLGGERLPAQYIKSHGGCARYVMTRDVVFVAEHTQLSEIADLFDLHGIGRVPVVAGHRVVGIVTRADLLKTIAAATPAANKRSIHSDESIRDRLVAELARQKWWNAGWSRVSVKAGVVTFEGLVETESRQLAARVAAENIEGVTAVKDERVLSTELPVTM